MLAKIKVTVSVWSIQCETYTAAVLDAWQTSKLALETGAPARVGANVVRSAADALRAPHKKVLVVQVLDGVRLNRHAGRHVKMLKAKVLPIGAAAHVGDDEARDVVGVADEALEARLRKHRVYVRARLHGR
jgi:hypothetical protein